MNSAIKALVEYFNGPNVTKHSIYLEIPQRANDAREFFKVRDALGIDGYMENAEAERKVTERLQKKPTARKRQ